MRAAPTPRPTALRRRRRVVRRLAVALVAATVAGLGVGAATGVAAAASPVTGAVFQPVAPTRLADTRQAMCGCERIDANTIRVQVGGRDGVPASPSAVALSLTVTETSGPGYATVWPAGTAMPDTSNLNWRAGETRANGAILAVGAEGAVDVHVSSAAQVLVDVTGAFTPTTAAANAGRFDALTPSRLLDTRSGPRVPSGGVVNVPLPADVPADATALAVTITATDADGWGYVVAYPAGTARPTSSIVNTDRAGQTRAATAIVPVSAGGFDLFVDGATHLIVDVTGWFTGASSAPSGDGMFVAQAPLRVWDTRGRVPVWAGGTMEPYPSTVFPGSAQLWSQLAGAESLVFNLTVTETSTAGWMAAYPARTARPATSSVNWAQDETVANLAIVGWAADGLAFYGDDEADFLVDVTGWFTGTPQTGTLPAPANVSPGYTGEAATDLVRDAVPAEVFAVLADVDMRTDHELPNGAAGLASTPPDRIRFAEFIYENYRRNVARSVAAHEVGHILTYRWVRDGHAEERVQHLYGYHDGVSGHECIAEAIGRVLFGRLGRTSYTPGYNGVFDACATSPDAQALANEIVDSQI